MIVGLNYEFKCGNTQEYIFLGYLWCRGKAILMGCMEMKNDAVLTNTIFAQL